VSRVTQVTQEWLKYAAAIMLILTIGVGDVWGAEEVMLSCSLSQYIYYVYIQRF